MRLVYQIPFKPVFESRKRIEQRGLDRFYRQQRHQADERPHTHPKVSSARHVQYIVVELIFIIPKPNALTPEIIHGGGEAKEVLEAFSRDVLVNGLFTSEFKGNQQ